MSAFEKIIPGAFLVCVALTACNSDRDSLAHVPTVSKEVGKDTVAQPNMPAPQAPTASMPESQQGRDSRSTEPLAPLDAKKESSGMPEALHGNNHSSPSVGTTSKPDTSGSIKKSSVIMPRTPKVIWV